jgi:hypothetical protein
MLCLLAPVIRAHRLPLVVQLYLDVDDIEYEAGCDAVVQVIVDLFAKME